jgi:CRP/FNR family cyclic AMP-dependent transcriptional regulator
VCALKLTESRFHEIATAFPKIWRSIAVVVAERLRQRARFHRPPNERPIVFIGSSVEGLAIAKEIQLGLKHSSLVARLWTNGVFGSGGISIDALLAQVDVSDFALFVFGPDDKITSRDEKYLGPRDNVVFELGLFMGRLDRERTYIVKENCTDIKIPSDLLGITPLTYVCKPGADLTTAISTVCTEVEAAVARLGVR